MYSKNFLKNLYYQMLRIRMMEESLVEPILSGEIRTPCHLYSGEEAIAVGVCAALQKRDIIFGYHRSHGHYLAKGGGMKELVAEIYGKETGCSRGRGGSMHVIAPEVNFMGSVPIVAGTISLALGAAWAAKIKREKRVAVSFFGDGATAEGILYESLNLASLYKLPILFACENNFYSTHLPLRDTRAADNIWEIAKPFKIPSFRVDGNDALTVFEVSKKARDHIQKGKGPVFLEFRTYRLRGHVGPDDNIQGYHTDIRPKREIRQWEKKDPLVRFEKVLERQGVSKKEITDLEKRVEREVKESHIFAQKSPYPKTHDLQKYVFAYPNAVKGEDEGKLQRRQTSSTKLSFALAINEALHQMMARDRSVIILGQGSKSVWYVGRTCEGLLKRFGRERVIDPPVSEAAMTGAGVGAAIAGMRPVVIHPRLDFMVYGLEPIINEAANWYYMFGGRSRVPMVIWGAINRGGEQGAQHSQALQALFAHLPGLKVVMPSTPYDAKGLMIAAILDNNPVVYIDDRWLYSDEGKVPKKIYEVPIGKGIVRKQGKDVTIVAISYMVKEALIAAEELARQKISAEVIDVRTVKPLDMKLIIRSLKKTRRLVVTEAAWRTGSVAAEIAARVSEQRFRMKAPAVRVCLPDCPAPMSRTLEQAYYITSKDIVSAVQRIM